MQVNSIQARYRNSSIRLSVSADEEGTIISIDNFPLHTVFYLTKEDARAFAERIINALDNAKLEEAA